MFGRPLSKIKTCSSIVGRYLSSSAKEKKIGIVGMGHVGTAVTNNLVRQGYNVANIMDIKPELCRNNSHISYLNISNKKDRNYLS